MTSRYGKVLIVDDEIAIRRALHNTLHGMGFDVNEALHRRSGSATGS